jgi:hypothetical protein
MLRSSCAAASSDCIPYCVLLLQMPQSPDNCRTCSSALQLLPSRSLEHGTLARTAADVQQVQQGCCVHVRREEPGGFRIVLGLLAAVQPLQGSALPQVAASHLMDALDASCRRFGPSAIGFFPLRCDLFN